MCPDYRRLEPRTSATAASDAAAVKEACLVDNRRGSVKKLGRYAASWAACSLKRPSSTAALT